MPLVALDFGVELNEFVIGWCDRLTRRLAEPGAGAIALSTSLLGTRYLIGWLRGHRIGEPIHTSVPHGHSAKAGSPTMGGVAIVAAAALGYTVAQSPA